MVHVKILVGDVCRGLSLGSSLLGGIKIIVVSRGGPGLKLDDGYDLARDVAVIAQDQLLDLRLAVSTLEIAFNFSSCLLHIAGLFHNLNKFHFLTFALRYK